MLNRCVAVSRYRCVAVSLNRCVAVALYRSIAASLRRCIAESLHGGKDPRQKLELVPAFDVVVLTLGVEHPVSIEKKTPATINAEQGSAPLSVSLHSAHKDQQGSPRRAPGNTDADARRVERLDPEHAGRAALSQRARSGSAAQASQERSAPGKAGRLKGQASESQRRTTPRSASSSRKESCSGGRVQRTTRAS